MPKSVKNLMPLAFNMENMLYAFYSAKKRKSSKRRVIEFSMDPMGNCRVLLDQISNGTYDIQPYKHHVVYEPKKRDIYAPAFDDVVVQHAIYRVIYPIFDNTFIFDNYGCRKGKGTHRCSDRAQLYLRKSRKDSYILQIDIKKFYQSIDVDILKTLIQKKIYDRQFVDIMMLFAKNNTKDGPSSGIPIGNLLSQLYALIYLNVLDQYVKHILKVDYYIRYVDDCVFFNLTKAQAHTVRRQVESFLAENLKLSLSKAIVIKTSQGINFVGYRTKAGTKLIRRHSIRHFTESLRYERIFSIQSILGHAYHSSSYVHLVSKIANEKPYLLEHLSIRKTDRIKPILQAHRPKPVDTNSFKLINNLIL